jgi:hypothetical protein
VVPAGKKLSLAAFQFAYEWQEQGDFARNYQEFAMVFVLLRANGSIVDAKQFKAPSDAASARAFSKTKNAISVSIEYADPACDPGGDQFVAWKNTLTVRANKGKIVLIEPEPVKVKEGSCGYAEEDAMIQGQPFDPLEEQRMHENDGMPEDSEQEPP